MTIEEALKNIKELDKEAMTKAEKRLDSIAKPLKCLGLLEDSIIQIAGIQGTSNIETEKKCVAIFCSDNGIVKNNEVTQCGQEVTAQVTENFSRNQTAVCIMAEYVGAEVIPIDIGVYREVQGEKIIKRKIAYGTEDITKEAAMTRENAIKAIETGIEIAYKLKEKGYKLIATGEMGIGNTTTTSAIASVMLGYSVEEVTGKGAGLSEEGLKKKIENIKKAIAINKPNKDDVIDILSKLGGYDIAGMVGLYIGGASSGVGIIIDGVISEIAALIASRIEKRTKEYMLPSHISKEPLGQIILDKLEKKPLICAEMRMGEGTGAVAAMALYEMINRIYKKTSSFKEVDIEQYKPL